MRALRYLGPRQSIGVAGFGDHAAGEIKDYPDDVARDLVEGSKRQQFEFVSPARQVPRSRRKRSVSHENP